MEKVHFLGINGSGIAGVACLAKKMNYDVDGCDLNVSGNYSEQLNNLNIKILEGQSKEHLKNIDKLVISAAVLYKGRYKNIEEITYAMDSGINILKWQEFIDKYLAKDKDLISICGTHGKTTTTTFVADLLEDLQQDPLAIIGGLNSRWNSSYRYGKGKYFVCESDEYGNNFLSYHPKYIIVNNIEMEHPEFFADLSEYKLNFENFLKNIRYDGAIIFNCDDENVISVILNQIDFLKKKNVKLIGYGIKKQESPSNDFLFYNINVVKNSFTIDNKIYELNDIKGIHNIRNALIATLLMIHLNFQYDDIAKCLLNLSMPKRRMEKLFDDGNIKLFDDYGHHQTQVYLNLKTIKENIDIDEKIIAILEPHMISRFEQNYKEFINAMEIADYPIITSFYKSRESNLAVPDMNFYLKNSKIKYIEQFKDVIEEVKKILKKENKVSIIVMGAGKSYKLSQDLVNIFEK